MHDCEGCGAAFERVQGARLFCHGCLPSVNVIGRAEYQRRYKALRQKIPTGQLLTVESLVAAAVRVFDGHGTCVVADCGRVAAAKGFCTKHHAQSKGRGVREARMPKKVKTLYRSAAWRKTRLEILRRDGYTCMLRETKRCRGVANSVDHTIRPEDGGSDLDHSNLKACCVPCNTAKRNRQIAERALTNTSMADSRAW